MPIELTVGHSRLLLDEEVGRGATSRVFRARCATSGKPRAVKLARRPEDRSVLADEGERLLFAHTRHLSQLHAAGCPELQGEGAPFPRGTGVLVLEWIEGRPLSEAWGELTSAETRARVALDIASALAALHTAQLSHGDVKPDNVLLGMREGMLSARLVDLGLASGASSTAPRGGTRRYLAPEVMNPGLLGDGRTRDLWAFGLLLGELLTSAPTASAEAITAELTSITEPLATIARRLLSTHPGARPPASWVAERLREWLHAAPTPADVIAERRQRIERAYLSTRRAELCRASRTASATLLLTGRCRELVESVLSPLSGLVSLRGTLERSPGSVRIEDGTFASRRAWLSTLVGPSAADWSLPAELADSELMEAMLRLAERRDPRGFTPAQLKSPLVSPPSEQPKTPVELAILLALGKPSQEVLVAAEAVATEPHTSVVFRRTLGLRLRAIGETGRALAVLECATEPRLFAEAAETARRAGDRERARAWFARHPEVHEPEARARLLATGARMLIEEGAVSEAKKLLDDAPDAPSIAEARALVELARDRRTEARRHAEYGRGLCTTEEDRARLAGLLGLIEHAEGDAEAAVTAFRSAVESAAREGAVLEEATYLTGLSAAAVDAARVSEALAASERAWQLFELLERGSEAARAALNHVTALGLVGAGDQALALAPRAVSLARQLRDQRCLGHIHLALADITAGTPEGREHAERALHLLAEGGLDDRVMAAARAHEARLDLELTAFDAAAQTAECSVTSRLEWWGARARRAGAEEVSRDGLLITGQLAALAATRAPRPARGRALCAGAALAQKLGLSDVARRMLETARSDAAQLRAYASLEHAPQLEDLSWVKESQSPVESHILPEQVADLETLVRALGRADALRPLLVQVLDALVLWTGVERGLLLLRAPGGRLVPRIGRNLCRDDLSGTQLELSHSLSERALEQREPVVAVDASGELESVHESVHALRLRSVLAVPLIARGEALGVAYLDDRVRRGAFGVRELAWVRLVAAVAAIAIAEARDRLQLRRAAQRAVRAERRTAELLAVRDLELTETRRELLHERQHRSTRFRYDAIVGDSTAMRELFGLLDRVVPTEVPVLLLGESGTGKELVARAIHGNGPRARAAFVAENCGAIPEPLLESALFGHVRGAFTGAARTRAGLFEAAHQGTLFLDEIAEMSLTMQTKLLRVLEEGEFWPVGSDRPKRVDVRVIGATHRDLPKMVEAGSFRQDLYYRLNVVTVRIPPLRERHGDIGALCEFILKRFAGERSVRLSREALEALARYDWPGNIRQLENELRRALVLSDGTIGVEHLSAELQAAAAGRRSGTVSEFDLKERLDLLTTELVRDALGRTGGNQTRAAELLGISRFGLQKMMRRLTI
jgi:serine/threonine-protein kinase PknK